MKNITQKSRISAPLISEDIKKLLANRDQKFLEMLFAEINPYLLRVCGVNGFYREIADDVIHETWSVFFANVDKFEGRSNIRTFICGILFNKIKEHRRIQGKHIFSEDSEQIFNNAFTHDGWWNNEPHDPHKFAELKQASEFVNECLDGLTEQQKTAFIMREVDDENSEEICNILDVNVTHLRVLIFRAKDKLRQCLDGKISLGDF